MGLALATNLKFYTSVAKRLTLKVRKFWGLIPTLVKVTREKLVRGVFLPPPILNRVKEHLIEAAFEAALIISKIELALD